LSRGRSRVRVPLVALAFVRIGIGNSTVESRLETPGVKVRLLPVPLADPGCRFTRAGSSTAERRLAMAEEWVRFPLGAWFSSRSGNSIGRVPVFQTGDAGSTPARCLFGSDDAVVAQWPERSPRKRRVGGSNPPRGFGIWSLSFAIFLHGSVAQRQSRGLISLRSLVRIQPSPTGADAWRLRSGD
jgi:hypothetical protein